MWINQNNQHTEIYGAQQPPEMYLYSCLGQMTIQFFHSCERLKWYKDSYVNNRLETILGRELGASVIFPTSTVGKICTFTSKVCLTYAFVTQQSFNISSRNLDTSNFIIFTVGLLNQIVISEVVLTILRQGNVGIHATRLIRRAYVRAVSPNNHIY